MTEVAPAKPDQKEFYDDFWSRTEDQRIHGPMGRHTRRLIRRALEGCFFKSVLDVSCGEGTMMSELFADRNDLRIVGTDLSPAALEMAAKKNPHAEFRILDLREGPFKEQFDLVISSEVVEHLEDDAGAIKCMAAMTGRYFLITTLGGRMRSHEKDIGHLRNYDPQALKKMVADAGLEPIRMFQWGWPFFSPLYRNFLEFNGGGTRDMTTGSFGPCRRMLADFLYFLFCFNSHARGDQLVILAERPAQKPVLASLPPEPFVSIVIPVRNEERYIPQCLASLAKLDYPREKLEIIFADGKSTDRTVELIKAAGHAVVENKGLNVASGRNTGFAAARGDLVAFTDADCLFDPQWLRKACAHFQDNSVAGLGGPTKPPADQNAFGRGVAAVFDLAGGIGATVHRGKINRTYDASDLPGCNCFYRREALKMAMPTNTILSTNEDVDMNAQIRAAGFRLVMTSDVEVEHYKRTSAQGLRKQMLAFAKGRAQLGKRDRTFLRPGHLAAAFGFPLALLAVVVAGIFVPVVAIITAAIALSAILLIFIQVMARENPVVAFHSVVALCVTAIAWPAGFLQEWFSGSPSQKRMGQ